VRVVEGDRGGGAAAAPGVVARQLNQVGVPLRHRHKQRQRVGVDRLPSDADGLRQHVPGLTRGQATEIQLARPPQERGVLLLDQGIQVNFDAGEDDTSSANRDSSRSRTFPRTPRKTAPSWVVAEP
jgi:hypothetical protein